jgi:integrase
MTTLTEYASVYVRLSDGSRAYLDQMRWAISGLEKHAGRSLAITDLTEAIVNDYLAATRETLAPQTRTSRRNMLLRLWRHAATNPALAEKPRAPNRDAIGKVRRRQKSPRGWSTADVQSLLSVADSLSGKYRGKIDKRLYWRAWILTAWSTGLRRVDLFSLHWLDVPASGRLTLIQQKTGRHVVAALSPEALAACRSLVEQHGSPLLFPLWCRLSCWRKIARRIVRRAGIGGAIGRLRHSAGTAVELASPGSGPQFLGNTPQVFYAHYFDRSLSEKLPQPPALTG